MQEQNNENTKPTQTSRSEQDDPEATRVTRVAPPDNNEATRVTRVKPPANEEATRVTRVKPQASDEATRVSAAWKPAHEQQPGDFSPAAAPTVQAQEPQPAVPPAQPAFSAQPEHNQAAQPPARRARRWPFILLGLVLVLLFGGGGTFFGYQEAARIRSQAQLDNTVSDAVEHFMLGLEAERNKQYEFAKLQFEYVIRIDPNFPGAADKLREVLTAMMMAQTPTIIVPTEAPTGVPTQDSRPLEEIYNQARTQYAAQDWTGLFLTIDTLRTLDPTYKAVELDGMLYNALRFRGIDKILHQANLEGGIYDLAVAEMIGPLDVDAINYRTWARRYLSGTSFWGVDWLKVMAYFEEIYPYFPNLRDSSGMTAQERYRLAAKGQGDTLAAAGEYCAAVEYYQKSMALGSNNEIQATAVAVNDLCTGASQPPVVVQNTPTPTPTGGVTPVDTPTEATPTETPTPTESTSGG